MTGRRSRRIIYVVVGIAVACVAAAVIFWRHGSTEAAKGRSAVGSRHRHRKRRSRTCRSITMRSAPSKRSTPSPSAPRSTARSSRSISARARTSAKATCSAKIDPAPFKAALDQAVAKKSEDEAQLIDAEKDLARFKTLVLQERRDAAEPRRATGQGRSDKGDDRRRSGRHRGGADPAQLRDHHGADRRRGRLPSGRYRQHHPYQRHQSAHGADADQAVHGDLHAAAGRSRSGARGDAARHACRCSPSIRTNKDQLAEGKLLLINNQIDQNTSTIQLKAEFPNQDERLWPGEFVHIRILDHDAQGRRDDSARSRCSAVRTASMSG